MRLELSKTPHAHLLLWPRKNKESDNVDWLLDYEEQFRKGTLKPHCVVEQFLAGLAYQPTLEDHFARAFDIIFHIITMGLIVIGVILPNWLRLGQEFCFKAPASVSTTIIHIIWIVVMVKA